MIAEILSCGTELLIGSTLNTNSQYLAQKLALHSIDVYRHITVGDNVNRLVQSFAESTKRADIILCSGGLGPTEDDVTAEALAKFLKRPLIYSKPTEKFIKQRLAWRGFNFTPLISKQCYVPKGSILLQNQNGTAPAIVCLFDGLGQKKCIVLLPGPPRELEPLFDKKVLPLILRHFKNKKSFFEIRPIKIAGLVESQVADKVPDLLKLTPPTTVGIYAKPGLVELKIMSKANTRAQAKRAADKIEFQIRRRLGDAVYGKNDETLSSVVGKMLSNRKLTIASAESCTGGLFSSSLTDVAGSSRYFKGGVIAYSNEIKSGFLGISQKVLQEFGAVSSVVARSLAKNIRKKFKTDIGVGITGIAGPGGGSKLKPVGLIFIAIADRQRIQVLKKQFYGSRTQIKSRCAQSVLDALRLFLKNSE